MGDYFGTIITHVLSFLGGLGAGFVIKLNINNSRSKKITQRGNTVRDGNIAGGDINLGDKS